MDTKQLDDALTRLFVDDGERIVFWHDPACEFLDFMDRLPFLTFGDTTVHIIRLDQVSALATKIRLERDEPDHRFLLYAPTEEPNYADDWLLDIRLYSRSFRADRASVLLDELGLEHHHLRDHLSQRRAFFDSKERLQKLKALVASTDTAADLDRKMLAVVVKADQPELFTIVRTLCHAWTDVEDADDIDLGNAPACWEHIEKLDLAQPFWQCIHATFGYHEEAPSLRNLLIRLLVTDYAVHLHGDMPQSLAHLLLLQTGHANAVVCLAQWRDSSSKGSSYDLLSAEVARILKIAEHVSTLDIEPLLDVMTFLDVEKAIVRGLRDRVLSTADTIDIAAIRAIATRRQAGHWASRTVPTSPTVPRQALAAVYEALVAAADFLALRNRYQNGLHFETAAAMYRAYETELYQFDQHYRHCCAAADRAESQHWDVLKTLREHVEAVYVRWYLTHLALAWGSFVEPAGSTGLLQHWSIDQVPNQHQFYQRHVQRRLEEAENRKVFVIISDAFRYEAAEELTRVLNGIYRFEADLTSQLGVVPSYTALGMASLLPHQTLTYHANGAVLVDGIPAASLEQRSAVLEAVHGVAIRADALLAMKKEQGRAFVNGHRVVYVYHNQVDAIGDSASTEAQTFQAVRTAITEITETVRYIVNTLNSNYVVITADHGFLFTESAPGLPDRSTVAEKPAGTVTAKKRYLIGHDLPEAEQTWHGTTLVTAVAEGGMEFWIPKGANRFHFTGGARFIHGGAMLQEIVVPVITVRHRKDKAVRGETTVQPVTVHVLGTSHKITAPRHRFALLQMEPVSARVTPVTLKVAVYEHDEAVTNVETVTFDSTSGQMDERTKWVSLVLRDRPYDKKTRYRLVLRAADTGIEQASVDVIIDRTFNDDF
jgi:uncharacterized protein (TIGR02687 family)